MHVRSPCLTVPAYFAMEAVETEHRHEYWDGQIWAMTGTTVEHADLVRVLLRRLDDARRGGPCRVYAESIRTRVGDTRYVYPDVVVACPPQLDLTVQPPILQNPKIVVEVLSASTESFDRGEKLAAYLRMASVTDVLLVCSRTRSVHHHERHTGGWFVRLLGPGDRLELRDPALALDIDALYDAAAS